MILCREFDLGDAFFLCDSILVALDVGVVDATGGVLSGKKMSQKRHQEEGKATDESGSEDKRRKGLAFKK